MIPKIRTGTGGTYGLIRYLFGPGKRDEHTDQHVVASWNDFAPDPGRNPHHTIAQLANQLDQPVKAIGDRAPATTIWHSSVRADPGDRHLDGGGPLPGALPLGDLGVGPHDGVRVRGAGCGAGRGSGRGWC
ncbi:hypothetical protein K353_01341 [Kitasatospora sp. SolWspMP-SS2h]|uniref:hypothetical protein n=1 Tax=Kitasatospora sp. SolWspMP-SS2h TaxID=1305729 RepID=UPI000DBA3FCE|nr:hypothetical protein K353_01341 [Kitasatospora sp. SolWspMP-SS2h]